MVDGSRRSWAITGEHRPKVETATTAGIAALPILPLILTPESPFKPVFTMLFWITGGGGAVKPIFRAEAVFYSIGTALAAFKCKAGVVHSILRPHLLPRIEACGSMHA